MRELTRPLLGWPAICALHAFANTNPVFESEETVFPEMFSGLGTSDELCCIPVLLSLSQKAKSLCFGTPRRILLPLEKAVELELKSMEEQGVILKINEPTDWCSGMKVVPISNRKVRICADFTKVSENLCRELHTVCYPLQINESLPKLQGQELRCFQNWTPTLVSGKFFWQRSQNI